MTGLAAELWVGSPCIRRTVRGQRTPSEANLDAAAFLTEAQTTISDPDR